jgi:tRNA-2-methylthio-N6-dimethylallyladenosine synthase
MLTLSFLILKISIQRENITLQNIRTVIMSKKVYIETYGCQMNVADSEMIATILKNNDYTLTADVKDAEIILINTCSIRDNAEQRIHKRIKQLQHLRKKNSGLKIGIIGCMAERMGELLFENEGNVNFLAGPDAYRNISSIIKESALHRVTDIVLSKTETYEDILPEKILEIGVSAFVPIMRGCENFCSYCVVPFTRGKERSRKPASVENEIRAHAGKGIREITLLGQNVNSFIFEENNTRIDFPDLIGFLAERFRQLRFRFATSHPKDISDKLLHAIAAHDNICKSIHLPMQSGSSDVLKRMNRKYTREWYLERIDAIRRIIPGCTVSTDIIAGFCGETDEDHKQTLSAMNEAGFFYAFMFKYSERPGTAAAKILKDDVPEEIKTARLSEIINRQIELSAVNNRADVGKSFEVMTENVSKRNEKELMGRSSQNKVIVFPGSLEKFPPGSLVNVKVTGYTSATLKGEIC